MIKSFWDFASDSISWATCEFKYQSECEKIWKNKNKNHHIIEVTCNNPKYRAINKYDCLSRIHLFSGSDKVPDQSKSAKSISRIPWEPSNHVLLTPWGINIVSLKDVGDQNSQVGF